MREPDSPISPLAVGEEGAAANSEHITDSDAVGNHNFGGSGRNGANDAAVGHDGGAVNGNGAVAAVATPHGGNRSGGRLRLVPIATKLAKAKAELAQSRERLAVWRQERCVLL